MQKRKKICDQRITFHMFIIDIARERRESVFTIERVWNGEIFKSDTISEWIVFKVSMPEIR